MTGSFVRVAARVPLAQAEEARAVALDLVPGGFEESETGDTFTLALYVDECAVESIRAVFSDVDVVPVAPGWEDAWRVFHRPARVGGLWIGPPWEQPDARERAVVIDPGRAFGTGAHPTTRLCVELLARSERGPLLDVGCGSGVLSIAAARLGFGPDPRRRQRPGRRRDDARERRGQRCRDRRRPPRRRGGRAPDAEIVVANVLLAPVERILARLDGRDRDHLRLPRVRSSGRTGLALDRPGRARRLGCRPIRAKHLAVRLFVPSSSPSGTTGSPTLTVPPPRMSARRPPRCTSARRTPAGESICRCEHGSARRRPTHSTSPIRNRRSTSALRRIPRVTTFLRASSQVISMPSARTASRASRLDQRQLVATSRSRRTSLHPSAYRSPTNPLPAMACASATRVSAAFAAGAIEECRDGAAPLGNCRRTARRCARPRSNGCKRGALDDRPPFASAPAGSRTGPEGAPNIRTASRLPSAPTEAAIQYPGHENEPGSATGTRPRFRAASHWRQKMSGSPSGCGSCSTARPSAPARHA